MIAFGPVPSRRLGRSVGVNNIPPKVCTYSCVYCQLGRTKHIETEPRPFHNPGRIVKDVKLLIEKANKAGESIDYLTFVADGEPSLDIHLGEELELIKSFGLKIAVITNSSLVWHDTVKESLQMAHWVSLKIDSVEEDIWRKINRPHRSLDLQRILYDIIKFSEQYKGKLVTETMLIRNLNDREDQIRHLTGFIKQLSNETSYLSVPIRPPAEEWVQPPTEEVLIRSYQIMSDEIKNVEVLIGYEGNAVAFTGDVEKDLLSITAVHPMREEAVSEFLRKAGAEWPVMDQLIEKGLMIKKTFRGKTFYTRKLFAPRNNEMLGLRME